MKLWEEWGTGVTIKIDEIIVSKSKDLAVAMGTGTYKELEEWSYVRVLRKVGDQWLIHVDSFHDWVIKDEKNDVRRKKRFDASNVEINGNNNTIDEVMKLLGKFHERFLADDAAGIVELFSEDCVTLDNNDLPKKGRESAQVSFAKFMADYGDNMNYDVEAITTSSAGDLLAEYGIWFGGGTFGNYLAVLKRGEDGKLLFRYAIFAHETPM